METSLFIAAGTGAVAAMLVGGLWYSPLLFGNAWKRLAHVSSEADSDPVVTYGGAFALLCLAALVFGAFVGSDPTLEFALGAGASAGIAWAAGSLWISYLFEGRSFKLGLINGGYHIVQFTLFGLCFAIL